MEIKHTCKALILLFLTLRIASAGPQSVIGSAHDLSPGQGGDACGFCHTPHGTSVNTPLWNQALSTTVYEIYQSSSLEAAVGQPTGSSKLCLSCHDGTVALPVAGMSSSRGAYISPGQANLGTDLSNDHPISFVYSDTLAAKDASIRPPSAIAEELKLNPAGEVQVPSIVYAGSLTWCLVSILFIVRPPLSLYSGQMLFVRGWLA